MGFLAAGWLGLGATTLAQDAQQRTVRETAGWHLLRPGDSLESLTRLYLGGEASEDPASAIGERHLTFEDLGPGDRVRVKLGAGLPRNAALLNVTAGRIDEQPTPVPWLKGRRFDILTEGDGLRTFSSSSAELTFADTTRLLITEDSLVFLGQSEVRPVEAHPGEVEIIQGQADLKRGVLRGQRQKVEVEAVEIVLGAARARPKSNSAGELSARARRTLQGAAQLMVYQGSSRLEAAGTTVELEEGMGSVVPDGGPPSPPEPLPAAPPLLAPVPETATTADTLRFGWGSVAGAASYTFELCRDPDCAELVNRQVGVQDTVYQVEPLADGRYFWRVTAATPSMLDSPPSQSAELTVIRQEVAAVSPGGLAVIVGSVRFGPGGAPLPGATVRIVELGALATSAGNGTFELRDLPPGSYTLEARLGGGVVGRLKDVAVTAGQRAEVVLVSDAALFAVDEIVVRPSRVSLLDRDPMAPVALSREDILALPHLGDDIFRALPLLPGTTANDVSAQFHVRGGRRDEVQVLLDGQELYDAFHLKDFDNAQSIVAAAALGSVDLTTGGWAAEHGDRMGGVLDMRTLTPQEGRQNRVGISLLNLQLGSAGTFEGERGSWLAMARRGSIDLAGKILGKEDPSYWDVLSKARYTLGARHSLAGHALVANDTLSFEETEDDEVKRRSTQEDSSYFWLTHQALLKAAGKETFVDTSVAWSDITSERRAFDSEEEQQFDVADLRSFDVAEVRQSWNLEASERQLLTWGFSLRRFEPVYDYTSFKRYDTPLAEIRAAEEGLFRFQGRFEGEHQTVYTMDRVRLLEPLVLELGLRYDRYSWLDEEHISPRLNLAYSLGESSVVRAAWGHFVQSQRPYELQVEDGESRFFPVERSEQKLLGFEHVFSSGSSGSSGSKLAGLALRVEAYRRDIINPRRRYENIYEPYNQFPELEPDRVLIVPERSRSRGIELFLRGPAGGRFGWWMNYAFASAEDRIDGRWIRRQIDQTHTLNLNFNVALGRRWDLNLAWRYHDGWPTTPLTLSLVPGDPGEEPELVPVLGVLNSRRLTPYHRLDLRASRELPVSRGRMMFFIDIQNVYDRTNLSGFDIAVEEDLGQLLAARERWPGIFPSAGISWEF